MLEKKKQLTRVHKRGYAKNYSDCLFICDILPEVSGKIELGRAVFLVDTSPYLQFLLKVFFSCRPGDVGWGRNRLSFPGHTR